MKFIQCRILDATPQRLLENHPHGFLTTVVDKEGYLIVDSFGVESWVSAEKFLTSAIRIDNEDKISKDDVDIFIGNIAHEKLGDKTTLVKAECTLTGYDVYATSSCVDSKNYDHTLGVVNATDKIRNIIWDRLGFMLQWAKDGLDNTPK